VHFVFSKEHPHLLEHLCFFDAGPGMSEQPLVDWAHFSSPTDQRESEDPVSAKLRKENEDRAPPFQAGGDLGRFGKGFKAAGFLYGESLTAVTKTAGRGTAERPEPTRELRLDEKLMKAAKDEWQQNRINERKQGREAIKGDPLWTDLYKSKDRAVLALLERADQHTPYSLFIVSRIKEKIAAELPRDSLQAVVSQLRDAYFIYCDGLEGALQQMSERASDSSSRHPVFPQRASSTPLWTCTSIRTWNRTLCQPSASRCGRIPSRPPPRA
jgi:hypothetical protein